MSKVKSRVDATSRITCPNERCAACGGTLGATTGAAYKRLQRPKRKFDRVAALRVEGVSKAAIARIEGLYWSTVSRWRELAAAVARKFNEAILRGSGLSSCNSTS